MGVSGLPMSSTDTLVVPRQVTNEIEDGLFIFGALYGQLFSSQPLKPFSCLRPPKNKHETLDLKREEKAEMQYNSEREREWEKKKKPYIYRVTFFFFPVWWISNVQESQYTGLRIPMLIAQECREREAKSRFQHFIWSVSLDFYPGRKLW